MPVQPGFQNFSTLGLPAARPLHVLFFSVCDFLSRPPPLPGANSDLSFRMHLHDYFLLEDFPDFHNYVSSPSYLESKCLLCEHMINVCLPQ